ncbi:MAG: hypothetical protein ACUVYA_16370 [Planctomycetota bacterium]
MEVKYACGCKLNHVNVLEVRVPEGASMEFLFERGGLSQVVTCAPQELYNHGVDYYHKDDSCESPPAPALVRYGDDAPPPWTIRDLLRYELAVAGVEEKGEGLCSPWYLKRVTFCGPLYRWLVPVGTEDLAWDDKSPGGPNVNWGERIRWPSDTGYTYAIAAHYAWWGE